MTSKGTTGRNDGKTSREHLKNSDYQTFEPKMVGMRIRVFRETRGWTQKDLAEYLDISREQVSKWERGNHSPKRQEVARLYFDDGLDFNYIYGGILRTLSFNLRESLVKKILSDYMDKPQILHDTEINLIRQL